ncbi:hypothetical protein ACP70R_007682 [Stipagrostis hirtigluma subsp. patula]
MLQSSTASWLAAVRSMELRARLSSNPTAAIATISDAGRCDGDGGGNTSIVSAAETATGWQVVKVEGYSVIKGLGVGKRVASGTFIVGGHCWCIVYYPDGFSKETADWICFALHLDQPATYGEIKVRAKFSLLDHAGEPVPSYTITGSVCIFSRSSPSWGYEKFILRKDLESSYLKDDNFWIRCDVTIIEIDEESFAVPPPDLHRHLGSLLAGEVGGDVTFEVGRKKFIAHKYVLAARSSVFKAEFFGGPMKEKAATRVRIKGIQPRVFKSMLHFIYNDSLPKIDGGEKLVMAQHLLVAADRYNIERLKLICENLLHTYIDKSTVATTLVLAEQHGCHRLKEACFKFLTSADNFKVVQGGDFHYLMRSCPSVLDELLAKHGL